MSTPSNKPGRRTLLLTGFVILWMVVALWTVYKVKPEFWKDGYTYYKEAKALSDNGDSAGALAAMEKALGRDPNNAGYHVFAGSLEERAGHADKAATAYRRALDLKPDDPEAGLGLAKLLLAAGDTKEAAKVLAALPSSRLDTPLLERRAGLRAQYGDQTGALEDFGRLLAFEPDNPAFLRGYAASAMALSDFAKAEPVLRRLLGDANTPAEKAWARNQLVTVLRAQGKPAEALALLDAAPDAANLALRAQLAMELKEFARAKPLLSEVLATDPGNLVVKNQLGIALRALGDAQGAYALLTTIPSRDNLRARAELALELERFADAATLYRELAEAAPGDVAMREKLAYALDRAGQSKAQAAPAPSTAAAAKVGAPLPGDAAAEQEYRKALSSGQAGAETRIRYAWLLLRAGRYAEAFDVLGDLAAREAPEDVLELAAKAAFLSGKYDKAIPLLTALTERRPQDAALWRDLADAYDARKEPGAAAKAMERFLELAPDDLTARRKLAGLYARAGSPARAETLYKQVLAQAPGDTRARLELVSLYESQKRFAAAIAVLQKAIGRSPRPDPELLLRLARLYGFSKNAPAAVRTYKRLLGQPGLSAATRTAARRALAEAALDAGDTAEAMAQLAALRAFTSRDPFLLVLAARAAMLARDARQAVSVLERLGAVRPLRPLEREWLAGQYRRLGQKAKALALYEALFTAGRLETPQGLEALGDLRFDAGKYGAALTAYERAERLAPSTKRALKIARAADKAGDKAVAKAAYDRFLTSNPGDPEVLLEVARFGIAAGDYARALSRYDQVVAARGAKGLLLELALANLAAKRFAVAEKWAREALRDGEGGFRSILALAQALHLEGKSAEADRLLRAHEKEVLAHPEGREWLGYVAVARDRQLQAYDLFDGLARQGGPNAGKMWLWRGIAATRRGDYRRARESFDRARRYGVSAPDRAVEK